jgi:hypothetical protein
VTDLEETSLEETKVAVMSVVESDSTRLFDASRSSTETALPKPAPATALAGPVRMLIAVGVPASKAIDWLAAEMFGLEYSIV